ncbi:MAG: peptide chain release factor 1 [Chlamydiae bacterium SM23_39]|nr:MAG: peptide chain release factor 1 [Chlamydiae bacterium SM23_39]
MRSKIEGLLNRLKEVEKLLSKEEIILDKNLYKELSKEYNYLIKIKQSWDYYKHISEELAKNKELIISEKDTEMIEMIKEEIKDLEKELFVTENRIKTLLVPPDPKDDRGVIVEIRAGTGGAEASLFVADCVKMYMGYANKKGWKFETITASPSDIGGYKEYIFAVSGKGVYRFLKYEGGTHRVQRVPETETQGRLHTSAVTIAVLLEPDETEEIKIDERELKIDTFRASGAGGQHVNVTDSAVRITHIPTNTVVTCQDERSQHKNKAKAMRVLSAKILEQIKMQQRKELSELRATQVGTGDRSERIRTYNFPQNRVTDHRINLTLYKLDKIMEGDLNDITNALLSYYYQEKLSG